ncbi:LacI family DNA-binding transcriptional regulator (plasmid) [Skermanella sp. TT6]|uniref:LacI family DNA-binding transcriptional regulator n=1 Tax=Skermanella cutis TaxID=2775420 RepID=A0ABX7BEE6_9PROT|nr:LacI family DNA-binding transcriptional regulator [Skermanella sp. TT6]QQP92784.1 LacI family DNA-binding transcriptional regulator [Skermanella sp. TT6]
MQNRPTLKDVAKAAGVSNITVSRVANGSGLVHPDTRLRVEEAMRSLGYLPNLAARAMRTNLTGTIGFLVPDLTNYPNAAVAQAAERRLAEAGFGMLLASSALNPVREAKALAALQTRQVDGVVLYVSDEADPELLTALRRFKTPLVVLDRTLPLNAEVDSVICDHATAMREVVRYLVQLGHRRIALLVPELRIRPVIERSTAFRTAAAEAGIAESCATVVQVSAATAAGSVPALTLLEGPTPPTAIIADGNRLLRGVILASRSLGRAMPADLSVIGIDTDDMALVCTPEITCIVRDFNEIGQLAADLMLRRLTTQAAAPQQVILPSQVVLRSSCGPAPRSSR